MVPDLSSLLQSLCEIDPPHISRQWINQHESRDWIEALIDAGVLAQADNASSVLCQLCEESHWITPEYVGPGHYRAFCPVNGFHGVAPKLLQCFAVDEDWIVAGIASALSARRRKVDASSGIASIGRAKFGPYACELFLGRLLHDRTRFESAIASIRERVGMAPAILLTSTPIDLLPAAILERCALISLANVVELTRGKISINEAPILEVLRGPGSLSKGGGIGFAFSAGFRSCFYGDQQFTFSDKQSRAIEALYNAWKEGLPGLHQSEIQGRADTSQRMAQLFSGNSAYGTLVQRDGGGLYRLVL